ncbi:unnamed protein product [Musa acuminata subsp. burmannicoides]
MAPYINSGVNRAFWERMVRKIESYQHKYITRRSMITEAHILSEVLQVLLPLSSCRLIEHGRHSLAIS